jgi:hypothetical protein
VPFAALHKGPNLSEHWWKLFQTFKNNLDFDEKLNLTEFLDPFYRTSQDDKFHANTSRKWQKGIRGKFEHIYRTIFYRTLFSNNFFERFSKNFLSNIIFEQFFRTFFLSDKELDRKWGSKLVVHEVEKGTKAEREKKRKRNKRSIG